SGSVRSGLRPAFTPTTKGESVVKTCKWNLLAMGLATLFVLSGCSTPYNAITKTAKVLWDPDIPVGYAEDLPSRVDLTMVAEPGVNPNESLAPTPIAFQIIEMRDSSLLMAGDFDQLLNNLKDSLGRNYIDHSD